MAANVEAIQRIIEKTVDHGSKIAGLKVPRNQRHPLHPDAEATMLGFGDHTGTVVSICHECGEQYLSDPHGAYGVLARFRPTETSG
ncbi:hypothetical protein ACFL0Y_04555 [Patescibacteria group bacterium]